MANVNEPTHWFRTMEDQTANRPCELHVNSRVAGGCRAMPVQADFAMAGTPCHPFSSQNGSRFLQGAVEGHAEYGIAMSSFLDWLKAFEPKCTVFEQVPGFLMPMSKGSSDTPYNRLLVPNVAVAVAVAVAICVSALRHRYRSFLSLGLSRSRSPNLMLVFSQSSSRPILKQDPKPKPKPSYH